MLYISCDEDPGGGPGACLNDTCTDPLLRVEAQVFLLVNDADAVSFEDFSYGGVRNGFH